jgi:hypothetical protein
LRPILAVYAACSLLYALLCQAGGYHPLAAFPVYLTACAVFIPAVMRIGRRMGVWKWQDELPRRAPRRNAVMTARATLGIITSSTLALLVPNSVGAILSAKVGCLMLTSRARRWRILIGGTVAVVLSAIGKPILASVLGILLGIGYVYSYKVKLQNAKPDPDQSRAQFLAMSQRQAGYLVALTIPVWVLVAYLFVPASVVTAQHGSVIPWTDPLLWIAGAASTLMGVLGTGIIIRPEPHSLTFPAYRMTSLLAALASQVLLGRASWNTYVAAAIAFWVVYDATQTLAMEQEVKTTGLVVSGAPSQQQLFALVGELVPGVPDQYLSLLPLPAPIVVECVPDRIHSTYPRNRLSLGDGKPQPHSQPQKVAA